MKIIIYGAGQIGYFLAQYFSDMNHSVTIIDEDAEKIENTHRMLDVEAVCGRGSYPDLLEKVGASTADILIAATDHDEFNMIACEVGASLFNISTKIAYIRDVNYLRDAWAHMYHPNHMPIDFVISPERNIATFIANSLTIIGFRELIPITSTVSIIGATCSEESPLAHKEICELPNFFPELFFKVIYIIRDGHSFIPTENDVILPQDEVIFIGKIGLLKNLIKVINIEFKVPESILIIGAGDIGYNLIKALQNILPETDLRVIDKSPQNARRIADDFSNVIMLQGDGLDTSLLSEANVSQMDAVVSVQNDTENNILTCLLAKSLGAKWTSSLIGNSMYSKLLPSLGINSIIDPQSIIISAVLAAIGQNTNFNHIYTLSNTFDGVAVGHVRENEKLINSSFDSLEKPKLVILGGVIRDNEFFIPDQKDLIKAHDHLILMFASKEAERLKKLF